MVVRTRFAPSPTGSLHVGSVRTALFSWLFAKKNKGQFVLRIEDTDVERSTHESLETILKGFEWIGLDIDEGPYYQSKRYDRYMHHINTLLQSNQAYRCDCSKERLEALRAQQLANKQKPRYDGLCRDKVVSPNVPHVIRFKNPEAGSVTFEDKVYGLITVNNAELDDLIILRSDKHPTYNFTVVVDDWEMNITHVIRGDDHINNTPRQINLLKAFNAPIPTYAHLPMILGADGKKLSKRHGAVSILEFQEQGILPQALINYLARLGWSHKDEEIFSLETLIEVFSLEKISKGTSSFDYDKLFWLNQHYMTHLQASMLEPFLMHCFKKYDIDLSSGPKLPILIELLAPRSKHLSELCEKSLYFYQDAIELDETAAKKHLRPIIFEPLQSFLSSLERLNVWSIASIQSLIDEICESYQLAMPKLAQPLRVAVTGNSMSPAIEQTIYHIGKGRSMVRLKSALDYLEQRKQNNPSA